MNFSLIVATRDRPASLENLLFSLVRQEYKNFEVIIIDQGKELPADQVCDLFSNQLALRYFPQAEQGLSRARNFGMSKATGAIIAFPDDDCWYSPEILFMVSRLFQTNPQVGFISGQYSEPESQGRFPRKAQKINIWSVFRCISSITLFFRREVIQGMFFDERLGAGSTLPASEETDFVIRLLEKGVHGFYTPELKIYHPVFRPSILDMNQQKAFGFMLANLIVTMHGVWRIKMLFRTILLLSKSAALAVVQPVEFQRTRYRYLGIKLALKNLPPPNE